MVPSYKYDYELSSKQRIFLYLYQVIPIIDLLKDIYTLKEESEVEDNQIYHGMCPRYIKTTGAWIPRCINNSFKIYQLKENLLLSAKFMKYIMEPGFICELSINREDYLDIELEEIDFGNWISVAHNVNTEPSYLSRIHAMNQLYDEVPLPIVYLVERLEEIYSQYTRISSGVNTHRLGINGSELLIPR